MSSLRSITDHSLRHSPQYSSRELKQKSNDVGKVAVPLSPLSIALTTSNVYNTDMLVENTAVDEELQALAISLQSMAASTLNASIFSDRFQDVQMEVLFTSHEYEQKNRLALNVNGNATFSGSYYLEDPESETVTNILVEEWNEDRESLVEIMSPLVCSDAGDDWCIVGLRVELLNDAPVKQDAAKVNGGVTKTAGKTVVSAATDNPHQYHDVSPSASISTQHAESTVDSNTSNSSLAWTITTIVVGSFTLLSAISVFVYLLRRGQRSTVQTEKSKGGFNTKQNGGHSSKVHENGFANSTTVSRTNIDQLLREFASNDDMSLASSDPSEANASLFSGLSCFSHLDLVNNNNKITSNFHQRDASTIHTTCSTTPMTYHPSTLLHQESFESKYRPISAMSSIFKKDMLHGAGECGENSRRGNSRRTCSPKKCLEMMQMQRMADRWNVEGKGRVGTRPASERELEGVRLVLGGSDWR